MPPNIPARVPVHGWIIVDKPVGMRSSVVVAKVKRLTGANRVGHAGTLDPLAGGVLPIALGEATKLTSYAMNGEKLYRFQIRWGQATTGDDKEGDIIETCPHRPDKAAICAILPQFQGTICQVPPTFSAVHINGKRAYALARMGKAVQPPSRHVDVHALSLVRMDDADHASFEVRCGKGVYVRSLARDMARALGTVGHVSYLRRTRMGFFHEKDAILLEKLEEMGHSAPARGIVLPVETVLDDISALAISEMQARTLRHGQVLCTEDIVAFGAFSNQISLDEEMISPLWAYVPEGTNERKKIVALIRLENGVVKTVRGFVH